MEVSSDGSGITKNSESNEKVSFIFETQYVTDNPKLSLMLVGSAECVGNWEIDLSRLATENPDHVGIWTTTIECTPNTSFDWKWALVNNSNGDVVRWEERSNRTFTSGNTSLKIIAPWNEGMEILAISDMKSTEAGKNEKGRFSPFNFFGGGKKPYQELTPNDECPTKVEKEILCIEGKECNCQSVEPGNQCANTNKSFSEKLKELIHSEEQHSEAPEPHETDSSDTTNLLNRRSARSNSIIVRTTSVIYSYCNIL